MTERRVLLVEDDPDRVMLTKRALSEAPSTCSVEVVDTGEAAIERLSEDEGPMPDLVLLDLKLPGADGFDVLEHVEEDDRTPEVPIVVLTSSSETEDMLHSYRLGANGYVTKPVDFEEFREAVRHIARFWLEINTPPIHGDPP
jgi:two-component system response regulator